MGPYNFARMVAPREPWEEPGGDRHTGEWPDASPYNLLAVEERPGTPMPVVFLDAMERRNRPPLSANNAGRPQQTA